MNPMRLAYHVVDYAANRAKVLVVSNSFWASACNIVWCVLGVATTFFANNPKVMPYLAAATSLAFIGWKIATGKLEKPAPVEKVSEDKP